MKILIIGILTFILLLIYNTKEGLQNYIAPVILDKSNQVYAKMLEVDPVDANVKKDLQYFNNATNILYGHQRIPNL